MVCEYFVYGASYDSGIQGYHDYVQEHKNYGNDQWSLGEVLYYTVWSHKPPLFRIYRATNDLARKRLPCGTSEQSSCTMTSVMCACTRAAGILLSNNQKVKPKCRSNKPCWQIKISNFLKFLCILQK